MYIHEYSCIFILYILYVLYMHIIYILFIYLYTCNVLQWYIYTFNVSLYLNNRVVISWNFTRVTCKGPGTHFWRRPWKWPQSSNSRLDLNQQKIELSSTKIQEENQNIRWFYLIWKQMTNMTMTRSCCLGFELFILADHMNVMNIKTGYPERGWHSLKISRSWDAHDITFWAMDLRTERCPKHIMARSWPGPFHSFAFYGIYGTQHHAHHGHINVIGGRWDAGPRNWSTFPLQPALNLHCIKADVRKASRCQTNVSCLGFGEDRLTSAIVEGSANCMLTVKAQTCSTRMRLFGYLRHGCMSFNGRWGNIIYVMHVCIECSMYRM